MNKIIGSKRATLGENISIEFNEQSIASIAKKLAIALVMQNEGVSQFVSGQQAEECFNYCLKLILRQDSGAKPSHELVPTFLSDIMMPLNSEYRGIRIKVSELEVPERPHSYGNFLDVLSSIGIPSGRILKIDPFGQSNVLKCSLVDYSGVQTLVGINADVSLEELIVRAMLIVPKQEQDKLDRVLGFMDNVYVSSDELLHQWACSLPVGRRSGKA